MANSEILVSVGIPTYNRPEGLRRTLESITGQTYKNLEIIVSDNCSPDRNVESTVRDFQKRDNRIQYFRQAENTGAINNFRFVLEKATGGHFMWAADDDFVSEDFIWQAIQFFKSHSGYAIVSGIPFTITPQGMQRTNSRNPFTSRFGLLRVLQSYYGPGMSVIYGLIDAAKLRRIRIETRFAEDRYIVASLAYMGKIKTLETMRLYRSPGGVSGGSISDAHRQMLQSLGIRFRGVALARLMMAKNAFEDVFAQKEVYLGLCFPTKLLLALGCFTVTIYDSIQRFYVTPIVNRSRKLVTGRLQWHRLRGQAVKLLWKSRTKINLLRKSLRLSGLAHPIYRRLPNKIRPRAKAAYMWLRHFGTLRSRN